MLGQETLRFGDDDGDDDVDDDGDGDGDNAGEVGWLWCWCQLPYSQLVEVSCHDMKPKCDIFDVDIVVDGDDKDVIDDNDND